MTEKEKRESKREAKDLKDGRKGRKKAKAKAEIIAGEKSRAKHPNRRGK